MRKTFRMICDNYDRWRRWDGPTRESCIRKMERVCARMAVEECKVNGINQTFTDRRFRDRYSAICSRVLSNLDPFGSVNSLYLIDGLIDGNIDPCAVADMGSGDLCPAANEAERAMILLRRTQKPQMKCSREHKCKRCGKTETTFRDYQARAGDEGSTVSIKCIHCNNVWRM
jgi:DNA-directed RNA polymerase subunit M/transcription elongation factor TFIIS